MTTPQDRAEQLLAAAATGSLDDAEAVELEALVRARPELGAELEALRGTTERVDTWAGAGGTWLEVEPSQDLEAAISRIGGGRRDERWWGRRPVLVAAAVALVAAGSVATLGVQGLTSDEAVEGPPGTLGAVERLRPSTPEDSPLPAEVEAAFVAHTWGTEAVLDVTETRPGAVYTVFVVRDGGEEVPAGAFLGSEVHVHCRMNAAVLRDDVVGLRIADAAGATVATASAPRV